MKKHISKNFISTIILIIMTTFFMISCGKKSKTKEGSNIQNQKKREINEFVKREFTYPIPTAFEISKMLGEAQTTYHPDIVNSVNNLDKYVTTWQKAVNLGVYGIDFSYAATFDETQEAINFLKVSQTIIDDLNISLIFNDNMVNRVEKNIDDLDSLIYIVSESFYDSYNYLNKNGEEKTSILIVVGSVIEGLYITCELIKIADNDTKLKKVLVEQKGNVEKIIQLIDEYKKDENVQEVLPNLRYISLVYDQLGDGKEITEGQFNDIAQGVMDMRNQIIN